MKNLIDHAEIAELLAQKAEETNGRTQQAFRRAARAAFLWPVEPPP